MCETRQYSVPHETLRRSKPGPSTVLTSQEEEKLDIIVNMADMGFGLSREDICLIAYQIAEKCGKQHHFKMKRLGEHGLMGLHFA